MTNGKFDIGDMVHCKVILGDSSEMSFRGEIVEITPDGKGTAWYDVSTTTNDHWVCREDEMSLIAGG